VLHNIGPDEAFELAERIRSSFAQAGSEVDRYPRSDA
jgi:hypothetical protein